MITVYNKTSESIGAMVKGNHVVIPPTSMGNVGSAPVSPKQADELLKRFPGKLTRNHDDVAGGTSAEKLDQVLGLIFDLGNKKLKEAVDKIIGGGKLAEAESEDSCQEDSEPESEEGFGTIKEEK